MLHGSFVALITPMHADGSIAQAALTDLIEWHIAEKTAGLVILGTTGEAATLSFAEKTNLIDLVIKQVAGRLPVIVGAGTPATETTLQLCQYAQNAGATACLVVTPYYNKPPQRGLFEHYRTLATELTIPIILYNVPGRTSCDLSLDTVAKLAQLPNIIGIKEATGNLERAVAIMQRCGKEFLVYSGDDALTLEMMSQGAKGVISVTANVAPRKMAALCQAVLTSDQSTATAINDELLLLHRDLFIETNPIPVKWALYRMSKIPPGIRLPLVPLDENHHARLEQALHAAAAL